MTKRALVSGASFAGLTTSLWLSRLGYEITVVELAPGLRMGGTAVDLKGDTVGIVRRMGLFDQVRANRLSLQRWDLLNEAGVTERSLELRGEHEPPSDDELEIERSVLLRMLYDAVEDQVDIIFDESIVSLHETQNGVEVGFAKGVSRTYDLVIGADGVHSTVRKLWFGDEGQFLHDLGQYFSITIVDKLLIERNTAQLFNVPCKAIMLNAYKNNTDIVLAFASDEQIPYDRRDQAQQRRIIEEQFRGLGWRTRELLDEVRASQSFYFDKLCQVRMSSWSRGRVVLVGDAAYCPSPAAGMGGSLAIDGATALADALRDHDGDLPRALAAYDERFRPFAESVQAAAVETGLETLVPRTEEAIRARNTASSSEF